MGESLKAERIMKHCVLKRYPIGNPRRLWQQDNFVLSTFAAHAQNMRDAIENCADAGYTMIEMGWAPHDRAEEAVRLCEGLGLDLLYQDFSRFGGMQERNIDRKIEHEEVKAIVDGLRKYRHTIGYYIWDEPYHEDELYESRRLLDMFEREAPEALPFTVAIPSYNTLYRWDNGEFEAYLERYTSIIDPPMLSLDYYPVGLPGYTAEKQLDNSLMWCDLGAMRKLGRKYNLPLWFYYQGIPMYNWSDFTFSMVRMMMYAAAMYGVKGLQQFTAVGSVIDKTGAKGPFFEEQKAIHEEFKALGKTLMALENDYVFHSSDLISQCGYYSDFVDPIEKSAVICGELPMRTSVGEFSDEYGNKYLLVLNRDFEKEAEIQISLRDKFRLYTVYRSDGRQYKAGEISSLRLKLVPGDAVLLRVQPAAEEPYTIEYRIEK